MRHLNLFGAIVLLALAGQAVQAQSSADGKPQVPSTKLQSARVSNVEKATSAEASLASINAELDRLQKQLDDLKRQADALGA